MWAVNQTEVQQWVQGRAAVTQVGKIRQSAFPSWSQHQSKTMLMSLLNHY